MEDWSFLNAQGVTRRINTTLLAASPELWTDVLRDCSYPEDFCRFCRLTCGLLGLRADSRSNPWWYFTRLAGKAPTDPLHTGLHISVHQPLEWRLQTNAYLQWRLVADGTDLEELDAAVLLLVLPI